MQGKRKKELKQSLTAASFLAPSLLGLILFSAVPVVFSMFISLTDWNYVNGIGNWNFVWFENFKKLWSDEWFRAALRNTFVYTVVTVPIGLFLAVVIAVLIDQFCAKKLAGVLRVTMYMPKICNIVASAAVWTMLYSTYGPFTQLMKALGWTDPPRFLASYTWALPAVMLMSIWQGLGYHVFLYSASLTSLPKDIYEAADLDGVNGIQRFFYITLPQLKPTTFFVVIMLTIASFKVYDQMYMITQGGPGNATMTLVYYIYNVAFVNTPKYGYASAVAMVLFVLVLAVTIVQFKGSSNND